MKIECRHSLKHDSLYKNDGQITKSEIRAITISKLEPLNHDPEKLIKTQDLEPCFEENSCIYIFSGKSFLNNNKNRIGKRPVIFEQDVNSVEVIDIDTPADWTHAERVLMMNLAHG